MKTCKTCNEDKELELFYKRSDNGKYASECRQCKSESKKIWYEKHKSSPHVRYQGLLSQANQRNIETNLTKNEYYSILDTSCHYCKNDISNDTGCGLDRIDNSIGYQLGNVLPCCSACNIGRNNNFTVEEWKIMIEALLVWRKKRDLNPHDS